MIRYGFSYVDDGAGIMGIVIAIDLAVMVWWGWRFFPGGWAS
jgi:hypothetical protein